jgi:predicted aldo/keto reductase-like oxidoreductase
MAQITIGGTGLRVEQNGFGALPIQRISKQDAVYLLRKAYDGGVNYYDSARRYSDSEEKLGEAFGDMWDKVTIIAMKALSGGLITNSAAACAWITRFEHVIPIWGIQRERELDEFLSYIPNPPILDDGMRTCIEADRKELQGDFCRGCGYCMPCPQGIVISMCARASLLLRRAPSEIMLSERGREMMKRVEDCLECGECSAKCPYGLDTPALLKRNYQDYMEVLVGKPL